jgi:hypothetical protein
MIMQLHRSWSFSKVLYEYTYLATLLSTTSRAGSCLFTPQSVQGGISLAQSAVHVCYVSGCPMWVPARPCMTDTAPESITGELGIDADQHAGLNRRSCGVGTLSSDW